MGLFDGISNTLGSSTISSSSLVNGKRLRGGNYGAKKSDPRGFPLLARDGRLASKIFGTDRPQLNLLPAPRFLFFVRFMRPSGFALDGTRNMGYVGLDNAARIDWTNGLGCNLKSVDRPTISFSTQTLNQYNKKRQIQTRVEYEPITMIFHDTYDMKVQNMFSEYFAYYYGDARKSTMSWAYDVTNRNLNSQPWGFTLNHIANPQHSNFFSHIEVYQFFARQYTRMDLINPKIVSFDPSSLSYEEGVLTQDVTMRIVYEGIVYHNDGKYLDLNPGLLETSGLSKSDFYETENGPITANQFKNSWVDNPLPAQPDIIGNLTQTLSSNLLSGKPITAKTVRNSVLNSYGKFSFGPGGMSGGTNTTGAVVTSTTDAVTHDRGVDQIVGGVLTTTGVSPEVNAAVNGNYTNAAMTAAVVGLGGLISGTNSTSQVGSRQVDETLDPFTTSVNAENIP